MELCTSKNSFEINPKLNRMSEGKKHPSQSQLQWTAEESNYRKSESSKWIDFENTYTQHKQHTEPSEYTNNAIEPNRSI